MDILTSVFHTRHITDNPSPVRSVVWSSARDSSNPTTIALLRYETFNTDSMAITSRSKICFTPRLSLPVGDTQSLVLRRHCAAFGKSRYETLSQYHTPTKRFRRQVEIISLVLQGYVHHCLVAQDQYSHRGLWRVIGVC